MQNQKLHRLKPLPRQHDNMSESDWVFFEHRWERYKRQSHIKNQQIIDELWACLDDELERLAFQDGIRTADPDQLIKEIKHLAVTTVHPALHVVSLHGSIQIQDEKIKTFCARIKGIAQNCNLKKTCSKSTCDEVVSFMEETCFHVAIAGLMDEDIKEKVLTQAMVGTVKDLSSLIEYVSAEESSKQKSPPRNISAIQKIPMKSPQDRKCIGCGMPQHGPFNRKECKVYGKICNKCQRQNHYTSLFKSQSVAE